MKLARRLGICATALLLAWSGVAASGGGPLAEPVAPGDLAGVAGGACVTDGTTNCPKSDVFPCVNLLCKGKVAGAACAGDSYFQVNPTFPTVKAGKGTKGSMPAATATLCGQNENCGPSCVNGMGVLICPASSLADYKVGTVTDPGSGACNDEGRLEPKAQPLEQVVLFAVNGGLFDAFAIR